MREQVIEHRAADDQQVAEDDQDDQPVVDVPAQAERHIDADQQRLVGERVEIGAERRALRMARR